MTYAEQIAVDLSRAVGVQPGSMTFHAIVGAVTEVIDHCAREAESFKVTPDELISAVFAGRAIGNRIRSLTKARP